MLIPRRSIIPAANSWRNFEPRWVEKGPALRPRRRGLVHRNFTVGSAAKQFAARGLVPQKRKAPPGDGAKGRSPHPSRSREPNVGIGAAAAHFWGYNLSGMTRCHPRVVPSPGPFRAQWRVGALTAFNSQTGWI